MLQDSAQTLELLERAGSGDQDAFNRLFAHHRGTIRGFIHHRLDRRLQARFDPSDVVQETQLEAYRRFQDYYQRRPMPFALWLQKTAFERLCNLRRSHLQTQRRSVEREQRMPDHSSVLIAQSMQTRTPTPVEQVVHREMQQRLAHWISQLSEPDREVLLMRHVDGLTHEEIALLLEIEPAAARKRYARALARLEQLMMDDGVSGEGP